MSQELLAATVAPLRHAGARMMTRYSIESRLPRLPGPRASLRADDTAVLDGPGRPTCSAPSSQDWCAVAAGKACASTAGVMRRHQPGQRRTSYWSRPHSLFAAWKRSSIAQRAPATPTSSWTVA
ncbi:hypothetical protein ACF07S_19330 [Streptomyces sp. NPDC016640]|uniref:hypothetical protein n=1 Tax=Streptomyces sp. NPDC016640 TaxID=3364969 RepID=UPI0037034D01